MYYAQGGGQEKGSFIVGISIPSSPCDHSGGGGRGGIECCYAQFGALYATVRTIHLFQVQIIIIIGGLVVGCLPIK